MSIHKPYLFIVNPHSGGTSHRDPAELTERIEKKMQSLGIVCQVIVTKQSGHAAEITQTAVRSNSWSAIVAAGGDGTVNEVARHMLHTGIPLGIIPTGSGNGLARHLHIPMNPDSALSRITEGSIISIDSGALNDVPFFCTAGIGFDAAVSHGFASSTGRGLTNYMRYSLDAYSGFEPVIVSIAGESFPVFLLTFANAGQFGNNAWIAPHASITDGLLDLCRVDPFPNWYSMVFGTRLFAKTLQPSNYVSFDTFRKLSLETSAPVLAHYDGEPLTLDSGEVTVRCIPKSLMVIC